MTFSPTNGGSPFGHLGPEARVAYDSAAPTDEVMDAGRSLVKSYNDPSLLQPDLINMMGQWIQLQRAEKAAGRQVAKALKFSNPQSEDPKARTEPLVTNMAGSNGNYVPKPGMPFAALRHLAKRIEVVQAIHRTRKRQVLAFAQPSQRDDARGWKLRHVDADAELSQDQTDYLKWITKFLVNGGREFDPIERRRKGRQTLRTMLGLLVNDALTLDHAAVETVGLKGAAGLDSFWVRDSATFFLSTQQGKEDADDIYAIQEVAMGGLVYFNYGELSIFQRNLSSDLEQMGYGTSELESSIETLSNFIQAVAFTREGIDNNSIPRGILMLSGNFQPHEAQAFQAAWQAKIRGAQNSFGLPVLTSRGQQGAANFIQTGQPFSEMAFAKWITLQSALFGSIYGMDPAEIGMESFSADKSSLSGSDTAEKLAASRDKGLEPFLTDVDGFMSEEICARFAPWVRFGFTGLDATDEAEKKKEQARVSTVNELRSALGMEPHPIPSIGELPADPSMQAAEFQRYQAICTVDEARKIWGGLEAYPDPAVGAAPINPSLQALFQNATAPEPDPADNPFGGDPNDPNADGPPQGPPGFGGEMADKFAQMSPDGGGPA